MLQGKRRVEVSPAHKIFIFAPPRGALVLRVTDDACDAEAFNGEA
jgi:hypothetical protein